MRLLSQNPPWPRRPAIATLALPLLLLLILAGPAQAGAEPITPTGATDVIRIETIKGQLRFVGPSTVTVGDQLEIVNETDPQLIGPVSFSLVTPGAVPKTASAIRGCDLWHHICRAISTWHGYGASERVEINPAKAGPAGWSTPGSAGGRHGDSWFSDEEGESFSQQVSAAAPRALFFVDAIHPWLHGRLTVLPASSE
jgi:hypothetical protein